jgi:hypothetical protein
VSRQRRARLEQIKAELRRAWQGDDAAAIRAAIRDPAGAPTEYAAAVGARIRIAGYQMLVIDACEEEQALEMLARDGVTLSPLELAEARRSLHRQLVDTGGNGDGIAASG